MRASSNAHHFVLRAVFKNFDEYSTKESVWLFSYRRRFFLVTANSEVTARKALDGYIRNSGYTGSNPIPDFKPHAEPGIKTPEKREKSDKNNTSNCLIREIGRSQAMRLIKEYENNSTLS